MVANINSTNKEKEKTGKVEIGNLPSDCEQLTELSGSEQRKIKGGTPRTKPDSTNVPQPRGGGDCDEFGCGGNHNETLVRDASSVK